MRFIKKINKYVIICYENKVNSLKLVDKNI